MKIFSLVGIAGIFLSSLSVPAIAEEQGHYGLNESQQQCYSRAMVGLDSVINSRIGVPIEEAIEITRKLGKVNISDQFDQSYLLAVIHAYMWNGTPHTYAIKVFSECTVEQHNKITQASAG